MLQKKIVIVHTNNKLDELILDMTDGTNSIGELLNDKISFLGQLLREPDKCNAVVMYGKNAHKFLDKNNHNIKPFETQVYGPIVIICMDINSEPQDFTLEDYKDYIENYETKYKKNYHN